MENAIIIPCYNVYPFLSDVLAEIARYSKEFDVYVVDDCCEKDSAKRSLDRFRELHGEYQLRVYYLKTERNMGVGGAWLAGLKYAMSRQAYLSYIKLDGDGQHRFSEVMPALDAYSSYLRVGNAVLLKGNRFSSRDSIKRIPPIRLLGNLFLSFMTRLSTGNWGVSDPVCGFFLLSNEAICSLELSQLSNRFLFETSLIYEATMAEIQITEFPMSVIYGNEESNLRIASYVLPFLGYHTKALFKRVAFDHVFRSLTPEGIFFIGFLICTIFSAALLARIYVVYLANGLQTPTGTIVMLLLLMQSSLIFFVNFLKEDSSRYHVDIAKRGFLN